jgi:putative membrane protein
MQILTKLLLSVVTLLAIAYYVPGIAVSGIYIALIVAVLLAIVNVTLKPILVLLTLPINILTLGLFTFVINALLFWFIATFVDGFDVDGFLPAFIGALILSVVSWLGNKLLSQ